MTMHEVIIIARQNKFDLWPISLFECKLIGNIILLLLILEIGESLKAPPYRLNISQVHLIQVDRQRQMKIRQQMYRIAILQFKEYKQTLIRSNMNTHQKSKNSPNLKEECSLLQTPKKHQKEKHKCPSCQQMGNLMCYGCCFELACQTCYTSGHYSQCQKKFNHYPITLSDSGNEDDTKSKRNGKKIKPVQKCQRCFENSQKNEFCVRCKVILCGKCIKETHSSGKFSHHIRVKHNQSPTKIKKLETFTTQTDEIQDNAMKKSTKLNIQYNDHIPKTKQRAAKVYSTPSQKKGKSIAKMPNNNQQNAGAVGLLKIKPQINEKNHESHINSQGYHQNSWQVCLKHNKIRSVLTQDYDVVCQQCYQQEKSTVSKIKNVDLSVWMNSVNTQSIKISLQSSLNEFMLKMKEIETQFASHRSHLLEQFTRNQEVLAERYKSNLFNLEKWQKVYKNNIQNVIKICQNSLKLSQTKQASDKKQQETSKDKIMDDVSNILNIKNHLALEEILHYKKQYYNQQEQYQFKINQISNQNFQEVLRSFNFIRKRVDNENQMNCSSHQKSLSKMNQSAHLRQSRMSNSSIRTDRKTIVRDDSFQKSNYYELSNSSNLLKRSISKAVREDIGKDISQKVLFQNNSGLKSQKRSIGNNDVKKLDGKQIKNSQYFFDSVQESTQKSKVNSRKQPIQLTNYCFKQVKYVDLQNFLTEKLDKIYDQRNCITGSTKLDDKKSNMFKNDMQISTELIDLRQEQGKNNPISDSRMTYSINISSTSGSNVSKMTAEAISSINNSLHNTNKNKRKSDYMEMRDRLRKPNVLHKVGK